ncbi:MAG: hypothetical protein II841_00575 [Bacteroidales bacterium]|nr:hypothetical protein [Bacteroidales bacterium]
MKKIHVINENWNSKDIAILKRLGVQVREGRSSISSARIEEDDVYYEVKKRYEKKYDGFLEFLYYEYTQEEVLSAPYCLLNGTLHSAGYPRPLNSYESKTFDMSKACPSCHMGREQDRPFRVSKLAKSGFWQYHAWEPSVYFVSDEVYESVFAPYGIRKIPVMSTSGKMIEGHSQLAFPVSTEPLDLYPFKYEICPNCGRKRYINGEYQRHPFFPIHRNPIPGAFAVQEVFGSGWVVDQPILLSAEVIGKLISLKEIDYGLLIPCTPCVNQYWGPKSDYGTDKHYQC